VPRAARLLPILGLLVGCTAGPADSLDGFGEVEDDGGDDSTESGGSEESSSSDEGEPLADDASEDTSTCGLVDVLFVIDNSESMADEQANLVASFPGFIEGIESILPSSDYHVGVVTTDTNEWNGTGCQRIGALTTKTGGLASSDAVCGPYASGKRFITAADDLDAEFSCAAQVGIDGDGRERPIDAISAVLHPFAADVGGCNSGFLREGALFVLVIITDEEDDGASVGDPADWTAAVTEVRGDDDVVVLGLVGHDKPNACIADQWDGMNGAEIAPRLIAFTESFTHGLVGDVCAPSYADFFAQAVDGIAVACDVVPVGK
jgi:hypothetical protein